MLEIRGPSKISLHSYVGDLQGVGTIRIIYPHLLLNHVRTKDNITFNAQYSSYFVNDVNFYNNFTFIQFQRAATSGHYNIIKHFITHMRKTTRTCVFYEIDDLLFGIPEWNYASSFYKENEKFIIEILRIVDGVTVSTDFLKKYYEKYNNKVRVIPNHLPKFVWGDPSPVPPHDGKIRIMWAGSENHFANKRLVEAGIRGGDFSKKMIDFIHKTKNDYHWIICGGFPMELSNLRNNGIEYHGWKNIFEYPAHVKSLKPDIFIAPLEINDFNRAKSNLKMLEAVAIGAAGIYSNIEPYQGAFAACDNDEDFINWIYTFAKDYDKRYECWKHDYELVKPNLFWEDNNNLLKYINAYLSMMDRVIKEG